MPRSICTGWTCVLKIALPILWLGFCSLATLIVIATGGRGLAELCFAWLFGIGFFCWQHAHLKQVAVDDHALYVSNYSRRIAVPITEIEKITENRWIGGHPVWITFRRPTAFGRRIMFMPPYHGLSLSSHPVVRELRWRAGLEKTAA
ncbi:MAG: hypothetical protein JSV91_02400 [Phycisphaerales bacterium]|nr:MAG: hypothetical protein JSV91_02400 [Phycisphaerales bacterium]